MIFHKLSVSPSGRVPILWRFCLFMVSCAMGNNTSSSIVIGQSPVFLSVLEQVARTADLSRPVLVVGERGTGKELIAGRLHYLSSRWQEPFLKINCATLAEPLLESEFFGHELGAFTGASRCHAGRFERAGKGTIFLDEIGSMSMRLQEKLLRVIEYGEFERIGGSVVMVCEAKIVGAANQDLPSMVRIGKFRADLLDRLAFEVITLPPLRARVEDIILLAEHFGVLVAGELKWNYFPGFTGYARERLLEYSWPGNVRELKNVVERATCLSPAGKQVDSIVIDPFESPFRPPKARGANFGGDDGNQKIENTFKMPDDFKEYIDMEEKRILLEALKINRFNRRKTADQLKLSYDQLRGYLRKHNDLV
jgi:psp operon transcriptional activator